MMMSDRKQYTIVPDNRTKFFTANYFQQQGAILTYSLHGAESFLRS